MKNTRLLLITLAFVAGGFSQANIATPCESKPHVLPDGRIEISDCKGKTSVVDPGAGSDRGSGEPASQPNVSPSAPAGSKLTQAYEQYEIANLEYPEQQFRRTSKYSPGRTLLLNSCFFLSC